MLTAPQAIQKLDPSELIPMDNTYKERLEMRKKIIEKHHDIVLGVNETSTADPRTRTAVSELYTFMLRQYLPTRYPNMFKVYTDAKSKDEVFENLITGAKWPATFHNLSPTIRALEILAETVDEDFMILLPERAPEATAPPDQPKYVLQAYANCYPAGFDTRKKLGLTLTDIHAPVPGYVDRLERSMDRFFARLEVGRFFKRVNWSITTEKGLFAAFGSIHGPASPDGTPQQAMKPDDLKLDEVRKDYP